MGSYINIGIALKIYAKKVYGIEQTSKGYYGFCNDINYIAEESNLGMYADILSFFSCGKVLIECYNELFDYLRDKIIKAIDNPLKDSIFITLD